MAPARTAAPGTTGIPGTGRTRSERHRRTGRYAGRVWPGAAAAAACRGGTRLARGGRPWPAPCLPCASPGQLFFQEGADLGQAASDARPLLDGVAGLACRAGRMLQEVVFQGLLMVVQHAVLALPTQAADA